MSYLSAMALFIGAASAISLLISKNLANVVSKIMLRVSNMNLSHTYIDSAFYIIFLLLCVTVPLVISFLAVQRGAKITVKEAIEDSGLNSVRITKKNLFCQHIGTISWLPRPIVFTMRNALRKKGRFILNVATLALSGMCFISVFVSMISVSSTLKDNLNTFGYDYHFVTNRVDDISLNELFDENTEIDMYEYWGYTSGELVYENGQIGNSYQIFSIPDNSKLVTPDVLEGSWIQETEIEGIVVGHEFLQDNPEASVGSIITLAVRETQLRVQIIGQIKDFSGSNIYMSKEFYIQNIPDESRQDIVQVKLDSNRRGRSKEKLIQEIEEAILEQGISILQSETKENAIEVLNRHYEATFQAFLVVIFMVLIVAAFGLSSTTNIQTLERKKEIGIMKAMGADKKQIVRIITSESVFTGLCGWVLSAVFAIGGIILGIIYFGRTTLETSIDLNVGAVFAGYIIWLFLVLFIGRMASRHSAIYAANMTVKKSLG